MRDVMRRQLIHLPHNTTIDIGINTLVKYKTNAALTTDQQGRPTGVVSKTDIIGAYYAKLPIDSPLDHIMSSPPIFTDIDESLESALEIMRSKMFHRLYVKKRETEELIGVLAYPDIVGMLYQICHYCEYSKFGQELKKQGSNKISRFEVKDVMTYSLKTIEKDESLNRVMEELSMNRFSAVLVVDKKGMPCGVISKTDLVLNYKHGVDPLTKVETIMTYPVRTCEVNNLLEGAIRQMIFADVQRLFVHRESLYNIVGVLSLTDAARIRSGSCHACTGSRIKVRKHD